MVYRIPGVQCPWHPSVEVSSTLLPKALFTINDFPGHITSYSRRTHMDLPSTINTILARQVFSSSPSLKRASKKLRSTSQKIRCVAVDTRYMIRIFIAHRSTTTISPTTYIVGQPLVVMLQFPRRSARSPYSFAADPSFPRANALDVRRLS